jgi:coenzyme F420-reducing hydrogenase gamma subunit
MKIPNKILRTLYYCIADAICNAECQLWTIQHKDALKKIKDVKEARLWLRQFRRKDFKLFIK